MYKFIGKHLKNPKGFAGVIILKFLNSHNREMYNETHKLLKISDNHTVLDIGCGNGQMLKLLAQKSAAKFYGIDISRSILRSAARKNGKYIKSGKLNLEVGSVDKIPFESETFSTIFTINTVYFWQDLAAAMAEIKRVLKPGGIFINALYTNETLHKLPHTKIGYNFHSREKLVNLAQNFGLEVAVVPIMDNAAYCIVCKK